MLRAIGIQNHKPGSGAARNPITVNKPAVPLLDVTYSPLPAPSPPVPSAGQACGVRSPPEHHVFVNPVDEVVVDGVCEVVLPDVPGTAGT